MNEKVRFQWLQKYTRNVSCQGSTRGSLVMLLISACVTVNKNFGNKLLLLIFAVVSIEIKVPGGLRPPS